MKQFGPRARRLAAKYSPWHIKADHPYTRWCVCWCCMEGHNHRQEAQVERRMVTVAYTDGKNTEVLAFDPKRDTPETVKFLTGRMRDNGWYPVKGSGKQVVITDGVVTDYVAPVKMRPIWKVA